MYFKRILVTPNATGERKNEWRVYKAVWEKRQPNEIKYRIEGEYKRGGSMFAYGYLDDLVYMMNDAKEEIEHIKNDPTGDVKSDKKSIREQRQLGYMLKLAIQYIQAQKEAGNANI